jgi:hypothetical protein
MHPITALPSPRATLADVNILPAQANQPVKYDANLAYFWGASSFAQKYWPPAFGRALASSDNEMPTQVEIRAMRMMPYIITTGPPELIPVTRAVEIPNHELVSENPTPRTPQTEKLRFMSWTYPISDCVSALCIDN